MSASELYDLMKKAIVGSDSEKVSSIIKNPKYEANRRGGPDRRTNLHSAVMIQSVRSMLVITLLLSQKDIDPNIMTSEGFSPLMLACAYLRMEALKHLLEKADPDAVNEKDMRAEDLTPQSATPGQRAEIEFLFRQARNKGSEVKKDRNLVIFIANMNYVPESGLKNLKGALEDLKAMQDFLQKFYTIRTIVDKEDVLDEIEKIMESLPPGSLDTVELMYSGKVTSNKINLPSWFQLVDT